MSGDVLEGVSSSSPGESHLDCSGRGVPTTDNRPGFLPNYKDDPTERHRGKSSIKIGPHTPAVLQTLNDPTRVGPDIGRRL